MFYVEHRYTTNLYQRSKLNNNANNPTDIDKGLLNNNLLDLGLLATLCLSHSLNHDIEVCDSLDDDIAHLLSLSLQGISAPAYNDWLDNDLNHLHLQVAGLSPSTHLLDNDLDDLHFDLAMAATPSISAASIRVLQNYKDAMTTPQADGWRTATYAEFDSLLQKGVYKVVTLPSGAKALPTKIVFKAKPTPTGDLAKLKARVVVRGDR